MDHWELPMHKKIIPISACPKDEYCYLVWTSHASHHANIKLGGKDGVLFYLFRIGLCHL